MLTHNVLAAEQGYSKLANVFDYSDSFVKKEDPHIKFFMETLEPVCTAYQSKRFGEMFEALGGRTPTIKALSAKVEWSNDMGKLIRLRETGTIGDVIDHLKSTQRPRLPDIIERREQELERAKDGSDVGDPSSIERLRNLRDVSYQEVIACARFIDERTPFSTKHGVKGAEFENVLTVFGRGWNVYDFNQFLEMAGTLNSLPPNKADAFERNRNLFYVACSRSKTRLAILFTQKLSGGAIATLANWFGANNIHSFRIDS